MRSFLIGLSAALLLLSGTWSASAADKVDHRSYTGPVFDVHVHAYPADGNGPAPNAICIGAASDLRYDLETPWPTVFGNIMQNPPCDNPIEGPATDEEVRDQTIAALRKHNARAVLIGAPDEVAAWQALAPELFIAGRSFGLDRDSSSAKEIEAEFLEGRFAVFGEITNQYKGVLADDPSFDAYWKVAADHDMPVGLHLGVGPPGSPMLFPEYRLQTPLRMEPVLRRHHNLRVYLMHAGYPFTEDLKAMLYAYPQLYVDTGVLQIAATREDYYSFLEAIVRAGFGDRILFGSDQMNWPGMIEEGINAINDAPFLTYEQKKAILHDNAARFLRLED